MSPHTRSPGAASIFSFPSLHSRLLLSWLLPWLTFMASSAAHAQITPRLDVPYVPTPEPVVEKMLSVAKVGKNDTLFDLGCGDGRIVITAAKKYGARGTGIDLNPQRIAEAEANARSAGVDGKVKFMVGDLFEADFSSASVVTLYLLPDINLKLRPQLWRQLKVGSRVVSHDFDMGDWKPEKIEHVEGKTIYMWTITRANKDAVKTETTKAQGGKPASPQS